MHHFFGNRRHGPRTNLSFTIPTKAPVGAPTTNGIVLVNGCFFGNGAIFISRKRNFVDVFYRVSGVSIGINRRVTHNNIINGINSANHTAKPRVR